MEIGEQFKRALKICDLTYDEAAELTGRSASCIKHYTQERRSIQADVWKALQEHCSNDSELREILKKLKIV